MNLWHQTFDDLNEIEREPGRMTVEQRLQLVQVKALLSIAQELSRIHHDGISPEYKP